MTRRVICINREHGTNGKALAEMVADRLGIRCYGRMMMNKAIAQGGLQNMDQVKAFLAASPEVRAEAFDKLKLDDKKVIEQLPDQDTVFEIESAVLKGLAAQEDFVVYGCCANDFLQDEDVELLRVFVTAPEEYCVKKIMKATDRNKLDAKMRVASVNRKRRDFYYTYTGKHWTEPENYDLTINMENLGINKAVDLLVAYYENVMPAHIEVAANHSEIA